MGWADPSGRPLREIGMEDRLSQGPPLRFIRRVSDMVAPHGFSGVPLPGSRSISIHG